MSITRFSSPCTTSNPEVRSECTATRRRALAAPASAAGERVMTSEISKSLTGSGASLLAPVGGGREGRVGARVGGGGQRERGGREGGEERRRASRWHCRPLPAPARFQPPTPPAPPTQRLERRGQQRGAADLKFGGGGVGDDDRGRAVVLAPQEVKALVVGAECPGEHLCRGEREGVGGWLRPCSRARTCQPLSSRAWKLLVSYKLSNWE